MARKTGKYKLVYAHLWQTYGQSKLVRISYVVQFLARIIKLIVLPVAISLIITSISKQDYVGAYKGVAFYVVFSFLLGICNPLVKYIGTLGENPVYSIQAGIYFKKLVSSEIEFFNASLSGYLTSATRQYLDSALELVRAIRNTYMNTVLGVVFPLAVISWLDPWLGVVAVALSIIMAVYMVWSSHLQNPYRTESREYYKANSGKIADVISNILAVKATAQETAYVKDVEYRMDKEADIFTKRQLLQAKMVSLRELITVLTFLVLLSATVYRMSNGSIAITAAVLVITYTTTILTSIYSLADNIDEHDNYVDKIIPAFEILNRTNTINDPANPLPFTNVKGAIEFRDVSFAYDTKQHEVPVFDHFSLTVPHGQKLGVVGVSGAGKSTLTKLLLRFDDTLDGAVLIDNTNIKTIRQSDLRRNIAFVPQEPILFHTSIRDNVCVSRPDATDEEIEKALKIAHASGFVHELKDGLDSVVGERGVKLSGGQKQRIAIARAVLQNAPIMVLDEATSALDSESEQIIKESFSDILRGKTAIVAAHRLSTLSEMDRIIVINNGKIIEDGTHDDLVALRGTYAKLWRHQQRIT